MEAKRFSARSRSYNQCHRALRTLSYIILSLLLVCLPAAHSQDSPIDPEVSRTPLDIAIQGVGSVIRVPDKPFYAIGEQVEVSAKPGPWHIFTWWNDGATQATRVVTIGVTNGYMAMFVETQKVETLVFGGVSRTAPLGMPATFVDGEFIVTNSLMRTGVVQISMQTSFPDGIILYTLDGSAPTIFSEAYNRPFSLARPAILRAVAFNGFFTETWEAEPLTLSYVTSFQLAVTVAGGGTVLQSPATGPFSSNSLVALAAVPSPGWTFLQWLGDLTGTNAYATVVMNRGRCVEAVFGTTFSNATAEAGAIAVEPATAFYPYGAVVRVTPIAQPGFAFARWGNSAGGTNTPLMFCITNPNPVVTAGFGPMNPGRFALNLMISGGGRVVSVPSANHYSLGTQVSLAAVPDPGEQFVGWSNDAGGTSNVLGLTMTTNKWITAKFTKRPRLEVMNCGNSVPDQIKIRCSGEFGKTFVLETSTNMVDWNTAGTVTNEFGTVQFNDVINGQRRFYRLVAP